MWAPLREGGAAAPSAAGSRIELLAGGRPATAYNGAQAQRLTLGSGGGDGVVGLVNVGLNCQQGLSLAKQQPYEGFAWLRASGTAEVTAAGLTVRVQLTVGAAVAAEQQLVVVGASDWLRYNFSLRPTASTECGATTGVYPGLMGPNVSQCNGAFSIALISAGSLDVDMVVLRPAPENQADPPLCDANGDSLPVRAGVARAAWGGGAATALRFGGSMVSRRGYRCKYTSNPHHNSYS